jgi:type VI secretion system protein ImpJ
MKPPSRVIWSEGLLMTPQHMQQLDRFHEERLNARLDAIDHESWGQPLPR